MSEYKDLNINRSKVREAIISFLDDRNMKLYPPDDIPSDFIKTFQIYFGATGIKPAMLKFHANKNGTTTLNYKLGKNQELGKEMATFVKSKLYSEIGHVNMVIEGFSEDDFQLVLGEIEIEEKIDIEKTSDKKIVLSSEFGDQLVLTYHLTTSKLQIQGRPLFCYECLAYVLSDILRGDALTQVLYKKDSTDKVVARPEVAEFTLRASLPNSLDQLPDKIKRLLVSGQCVKSSSPDLEDYSLLTYSELKGLEGVIKHQLLINKVSIDDESIEKSLGLGGFFDISSSKVTLKEKYAEEYQGANVSYVCEAYKYYRETRHSLFHMEYLTQASRSIDSLDDALKICTKAYSLIEKIYE